jgi:hypothetical protein
LLRTRTGGATVRRPASSPHAIDTTFLLIPAALLGLVALTFVVVVVLRLLARWLREPDLADPDADAAP